MKREAERRVYENEKKKKISRLEDGEWRKLRIRVKGMNERDKMKRDRKCRNC